MTLRLRVDSDTWKQHVERVAASYSSVSNGSLVPVVKGNGYGFGRTFLTETAAELLAGFGVGDAAQGPPTLAVGTIHELPGIPAPVRPLVLTPPAADRGTAGSTSIVERLRAVAVDPIVTVGKAEHVGVLAGWNGAVLVKLGSSMRRFGVEPDELDAFERTVHDAGLRLAGHSVHLPVAGGDADRVAEVDRWLAVLDVRPAPKGASRSLWVSHLGADAYRALCERWPAWTFPMRVGTWLWHGDKSALHLGATVLDVRQVSAGSLAGYHGSTVFADGSLVIIGAGTAHCVTTLEDGRSPFHFRRRRLALVERPHMHTSTAVVPTGDECPAIGDVVDVQRPLISVSVDEVIWQ